MKEYRFEYKTQNKTIVSWCNAMNRKEAEEYFANKFWLLLREESNISKFVWEEKENVSKNDKQITLK